MAEDTETRRSSLLEDLGPALHLCDEAQGRRCRRRMGHTTPSTGRGKGIQEVFADEIADEARGPGENEPPSQ
jgi:hypothetical protein